MDRRDLLTIGGVSARSGLGPSVLRYYESLGLITSTRTSGDRRPATGDAINAPCSGGSPSSGRLSRWASAPTRYGPLSRGFPATSPPQTGWARMSAAWQPLLAQRIAEMQQVRDKLTNCIGCGCLSMTACRLYNSQDTLVATGSGSRRPLPEPQSD